MMFLSINCVEYLANVAIFKINMGVQTRVYLSEVIVITGIYYLSLLFKSMGQVVLCYFFELIYSANLSTAVIL